MTLTFKSELESERPLKDFWLKFEMPFPVSSLGPPLWAETVNCCDFATIPFLETTEISGGEVNGRHVIYVQLKGSTYDKKFTYIMQITPDKYMTK